MRNIHLNSCPFCGSTASIHYVTYPNGESAYTISCWHDDGCYLEKGISPDFDTEEEAAQAWNHRDSNEEEDY